MTEPNRFDDFINAYPRQSLQLLLVAIFLFWQSMACVVGIILYAIMHKLCRIHWWVILSVGALFGIIITGIEYGSSFNLHNFIVHGFTLNLIFWKSLIAGKSWAGLSYLYHHGAAYQIGVPLFFAGLLSAAHLIKNNPHQNVIKSLQEGRIVNEWVDLPEKQIESALKKINDESEIGAVLGVSKYSAKNVVIPDKWINQIMLVLGTTGAGKTVTLQRFYERAMKKGYPLIIVDGKPTNANVSAIETLAKNSGRKFYGFNSGNYTHYDPLTSGGYTELKDKIIGLKDQWENDYYRSIAEAYLQVTFEVLLRWGKPFDLEKVVECLNHDDLSVVAREVNDEALSKRVAALEAYESKDITGLRAHLSLLVHSELGEYFKNSENKFTLSQAISEDAVVYFALPALRFPSFSTVLGKLVINDLKATIDREEKHDKKIFMVFDEFSVFAGNQVLNLVNMGRGKGMHAIFGTQGLADLNAVDENFKNQVLNCVNTIICHRLNDQDSAESVAAWIGTRDAFTVTAKVDTTQADGRHGSVRINKEYIVHPEQIKQDLRIGEAFWATKVGSGSWGKVRVYTRFI